jgi:hypothetical protein
MLIAKLLTLVIISFTNIVLIFLEHLQIMENDSDKYLFICLLSQVFLSTSVALCFPCKNL